MKGSIAVVCFALWMGAEAGSVGWGAAARHLRQPGSIFYSAQQYQPYSYYSYNTIPLRYTYGWNPQLALSPYLGLPGLGLSPSPTPVYFTTTSPALPYPPAFPGAPAPPAPEITYEDTTPVEQPAPPQDPTSPPSGAIPPQFPPQFPASSPIFPGGIPNIPGFPSQPGNLPTIPGLPTFPGNEAFFPGAPSFPGSTPSFTAEIPPAPVEPPSSFPSAGNGGDKGLNDEDSISVESA